MDNIPSKRLRKKIFFDDYVYNMPSSKSFRKKRVKFQGDSEVDDDEDQLAIRSTNSGSECSRDVVSNPTSECVSSNNEEALLKNTNDSLKVGLRLRNFVTLPKSFRWMYVEFFTSSIDEPLFSKENDFVYFLEQFMPELRTRRVTRTEWAMIRHLMGKPRRFSKVFLQQERDDLERKRNAIREVQYCRNVPPSDPAYLPNQIPMRAVIGSKVNARLRKPLDGIFVGTVIAIDVSNHNYRITFDREGLGTHFVPDYEILAAEPVEKLSATSVLKSSQHFKQMFACPSDRLNGASYSPDTLSYNNVPQKCLVRIVNLKKALESKRVIITKLRDINAEAEKSIFHGKILSHDFQRQYAYLVVSLEKLNVDIQMNIKFFEKYCEEFSDIQKIAGIPPSDNLMYSKQFSNLIGKYSGKIHNDRLRNLIIQLMTVLLHLKSLSTTDYKMYEISKLNESLKKIRTSIFPKNYFHFQSNVEMHLQHCLKFWSNN